MATKPRLYGRHNDEPADPMLCVEQVCTNWVFNQCSRKRGHGEEGLQCRQHAKVSQKRKQDKIRWNEEAEALAKRWEDERENGRLLSDGEAAVYALTKACEALYDCVRPTWGKAQGVEGMKKDDWVKERVDGLINEAGKARVKE